MENDFFLFRNSCEYIIVSKEIDPESITNELSIIPNRSFKKGETSYSKHSGSLITRTFNLWAITSKKIISEDNRLKPHIEYLKSILFQKKEILQKYKNSDLFEPTFWVWIETNDAGIGFDLSNSELDFINEISNRVSFSLIINSQLRME
jgi:hypothetical protein